MNLEIEALAGAVRGNRRRKAARALLMSALIAIITLLLILVIIPYASGNTTWSPLVRRTEGFGSAIILVAIALGLDLGLALLYVPGLIRDRAYYRRFTARAADGDLQRLAMFMNALDGIRMKAGLSEPDVVVLDSDAPNAVTFAREGQAVVGVTRGILVSGLSYAEAEAVMAHQLAGIMTDDYLKQPTAWCFEARAYALLGIYSITALAAAPMFGAGRGVGAGVGFLLAASVILLIGGYLVKKLRDGDAHDYLLADTVASELTGKAEELAGAVKKLDALLNGSAGTPFPDNELGLKYLFAFPYRWNETAEQFVNRRHGDLGLETTEASRARQAEGVQRVMDELEAWGEKLLEERLENLQAG